MSRGHEHNLMELVIDMVTTHPSLMISFTAQRSAFNCDEKLMVRLQIRTSTDNLAPQACNQPHCRGISSTGIPRTRLNALPSKVTGP